MFSTCHVMDTVRCEKQNAKLYPINLRTQSLWTTETKICIADHCLPYPNENLTFHCVSLNIHDDDWSTIWKWNTLISCKMVNDVFSWCIKIKDIFYTRLCDYNLSIILMVELPQFICTVVKLAPLYTKHRHHMSPVSTW